MNAAHHLPPGGYRGPRGPSNIMPVMPSTSCRRCRCRPGRAGGPWECLADRRTPGSRYGRAVVSGGWRRPGPTPGPAGDGGCRGLARRSEKKSRTRGEASNASRRGRCAGGERTGGRTPPACRWRGDGGGENRRGQCSRGKRPLLVDRRGMRGGSVELILLLWTLAAGGRLRRSRPGPSGARGADRLGRVSGGVRVLSGGPARRGGVRTHKRPRSAGPR